MVDVSDVWIKIELLGFSGGEDQKIPCIRKNPDLKNKAAQAGSPHLSRRITKKRLGVPVIAVSAVDNQQMVSHISGHPFSPQSHQSAWPVLPQVPSICPQPTRTFSLGSSLFEPSAHLCSACKFAVRIVSAAPELDYQNRHRQIGLQARLAMQTI